MDQLQISGENHVGAGRLVMSAHAFQLIDFIEVYDEHHTESPREQHIFSRSRPHRPVHL